MATGQPKQNKIKQTSSTYEHEIAARAATQAGLAYPVMRLIGVHEVHGSNPGGTTYFFLPPFPPEITANFFLGVYVQCLALRGFHGHVYRY